MDLIIDGLKLMVFGMGGVFIFLTLMVILISLTAKVVAPFSTILDKPTVAPTRKPAAKKSSDNDKVLMAAAAAAVHKHRSKNQ
jgi:oxaloacetate decarboxylase gamma subunit